MRISRFATAAASAALVTAGFAGISSTAEAAARWAPASKAKIYPGIQTNTAGGGQCTANFVFTDSAANVYLGQSAHCGGLGAATDTNGCDSGSVPLGTKVTFNAGGSLVSYGTQVGAGKLVYSSWITMQRRKERNANACAYNDFALIKVNTADKGKVNPTVPYWGGPVAINTKGLDAGDEVYSYGNSGLRGGIEALSPKTGVAVGDDPADGGWSHSLYTMTPGVPGDSGSAFLDPNGRAVGTLSTISIAPLPASNNIGDLNKELNYAKAYSGISGLRLALGTEPFKGLN